MIEVFLDVETKKAFADAGNFNPGSLGVSFTGICVREAASGKEDEFQGFFEPQLPKLWPVLEQADRIIGFNIIGFDFPSLAPYYPGNLFSLPCLDILAEVKKAVGHRVSLNALARETLGVTKSGSGLDAITYFEEGRFEELAKYCLMDVRITRDLYDYGKKYRELKFINKWNRQISVPVDFAFKPAGGGEVQMSLGV